MTHPGATVGETRRHGGSRVLLAAGLIALATTLTLAILTELDVADSYRASLTDNVQPRVEADPNLIVVSLDEDYQRMATGDGSVNLALAEGLAESGATTVALDPAWGEVSNPGLDDATLRAIAADRYRQLDFDQSLFLLEDAALEDAPRGSRIPRLASHGYDPVFRGAAGAVAIDDVELLDETVPLRRTPLVAENDAGDLVPAGSLVTFIRAFGLPNEIQETTTGLTVGGRRDIPTESSHLLRVAFATELLPGGAQVRPALEVLDEIRDIRQDPNADLGSWLEGATVVVAVTDGPEAAQIPVAQGPDEALPAGLVRAQAANTLLTGEFLRPVPTPVVLAVAWLLSFAVAVASLTWPVWVSPLVAVGLGAASWFGAVLAAQARWLPDPSIGIAAVTLGLVAALSTRGTLEWRHRRRVADLFAHYVPPDVAKELVEENRAELAAAGQRLEVTSLFCDLRGFTAVSAELTPTEVRELLDHFYETTSQLVLDHGGTVMKYVGDEVFAVFGAPLPDQGHAAAGLDCALEMLAAAPALNRKVTAAGLPEITYGIGVHCGEVVAAHVGSSSRRQYDVVGDSVNVASRLCSQAGPNEIVTSEQVLAAANPKHSFEELGPLELKGVSAEIIGYRATGSSLERDPVPDRIG